MSATVLGNLVLGYQLVWDRGRRPRGVHLRVEATVDEAVDAAHLLRILAESWAGTAPQLILSTPETWLLREFLQHADAQAPWIVVHQDQLALPGMDGLAQAAQARGAALLWRAQAGTQPPPQAAGSFARRLLSLKAGGAGSEAADQVCESVPSLALARQCLDERGAWGVAGWPVEDVLAHGRQQQPLSDRPGLRALIAAVDADASLERIEQVMDKQPVLVYRFLLYLRAASKGPHNAAESLRHGLMMLGLRNLREWLQQQMAQAGDDADLWPVRRPMVLRAELAEALVDAGEEDQLRREVYLCALLSDMPRLLGEPLPTVLERLELPGRITSALLEGTGPYAPLLAIADALGSHARSAEVHALCGARQLDLAEVNRVLLRTLVQLHARPPAAR